MRSAAKKVEPKIACQEVARVEGVVEGAILVDAGAGEYEAKRAVSCLVEPMLGDVVLVSVAPGVCYVLAVLEREGRAASVVVEGDPTVKVPRGRFVVAAAEGVDLVSGKAATLTADDVRVNARTGSLLIESLSYVGTVVQAQLEKAKIAATTLDTSVERLTQRAKRAYRFVEQFEQVRAARLDYTAKKNLSLHAENALVTAEQLVKVDGAEIHLG
ncbi:hypothetical protein A7982_13583 [Minicystis rosea]|nr:hypothetical protein A7982_13583 [Minicystis rosea]